MEVKVQLKTAQATVASSLGYETEVSTALREIGLRLYPVHPGTQDSRQATLFRVPVPDRETADRAVELLRGQGGVQSAAIA
jgi:hypothetical protein